MATTQQLMTVEEFAAIDEPGRYDLIRGELLCMSPAGGVHGEIASEIHRRLANFVVEHDLGRVYIDETGFILAQDPDIVLCPDVAFVPEDRLPPREERHGFLPLAPDLVVEVVSPSDRMGQVNDKVVEYLNAGVRLVWVVEPRRRRLTVYTPDRNAHLYLEDDTLDGGEVLPGFTLQVPEVFR